MLNPPKPVTADKVKKSSALDFTDANGQPCAVGGMVSTSVGWLISRLPFSSSVMRLQPDPRERLLQVASCRLTVGNDIGFWLEAETELRNKK